MKKAVLALYLLSGPAMFAQDKVIDPGGWTKAKWGMTEAQIKTAFPEAKPIIDNGDPLLGLEHYEVGPIKYRVTFYFDKKGGGLNGVALQRRMAMPRRGYMQKRPKVRS